MNKILENNKTPKIYLAFHFAAKYTNDILFIIYNLKNI